MPTPPRPIVSRFNPPLRWLAILLAMLALVLSIAAPPAGASVNETERGDHALSRYSYDALVVVASRPIVLSNGFQARVAQPESAVAADVGTSGHIYDLPVDSVAPSTRGLDWDAVVKKSTGETRYEHVTKHNVPNINKKSHGVFYDDAVGTTNEAWARAQQSGLSPLTTDGVDIYTVPMGRDVGFAGGADANALAGVPHTSVEIIVQSGTNNIITAYPVPGS